MVCDGLGSTNLRLCGWLDALYWGRVKQAPNHTHLLADTYKFLAPTGAVIRSADCTALTIAA